MDYGYGDDAPNPEGGSTTVYDKDYWTKQIHYLMDNGYPVDQIAKDFLAVPDDYFISASGGITKKNWLNQHVGLATILFAAAPFIAGGAGALVAGSGSAAPVVGGTAAEVGSGGAAAAGGTAAGTTAATTAGTAAAGGGATAAGTGAAAAIPHIIGPVAVGTAGGAGTAAAVPAIAAGTAAATGGAVINNMMNDGPTQAEDPDTQGPTQAEDPDVQGPTQAEDPSAQGPNQPQTPGKSTAGKVIDDVQKGKNIYDDISKTLGTYADTETNNQSNLDRDRIDAQKERNSNESDALRKLMVTKYLQDGHGGYTPPTISGPGGNFQLPLMRPGYSAPSAAQKQGASTLEPMLTSRLAPGGSVWPEGPDTGAKIANAGSYIASGLGTLTKYDPNWMQQAGGFIKGLFT